MEPPRASAGSSWCHPPAGRSHWPPSKGAFAPRQGKATAVPKTFPPARAFHSSSHVAGFIRIVDEGGGVHAVRWNTTAPALAAFAPISGCWEWGLYPLHPHLWGTAPGDLVGALSQILDLLQISILALISEKPLSRNQWFYGAENARKSKFATDPISPPPVMGNRHESVFLGL